MKKIWWVVIVPGILAVAAGAFALLLFLIKLLWAWTVPDLFPGAVEQGLVVGTISWVTALKLAVFVAVLSGLASALASRHGSKEG